MEGERLLMSPLSIKQKPQALDTVIGTFMPYSMPLSLMTLSNVSKCDDIKLNICKRINKLPRSTPSAMIIILDNPPRQEACRSGRNLEEGDLCQADMHIPDKSSK